MYSTHLKNRNGHYFFRIRIPSDLTYVLPRSEIVKSLKTSDIKTAKASSLQYMQGIVQTFSLLRSRFITPAQAHERLYSLLKLKRRDTPQDSIKTAHSPHKESALLSLVVSTYTNDKEHEWTAKTKMEMTGVFRLILDLIGDLPMDSVDRGTARELREKLLKIPPNVYKVHSKLSPLEVLKLIDSGKLTDSPSMSLTSVNKHMTKFSTLMLYCVKEGHRKDNPAGRMNIKQKRRQDEERKALFPGRPPEDHQVPPP